MSNTKVTKHRGRGRTRRKPAQPRPTRGRPVRRTKPTSNILARFANVCRNLVKSILEAFSRFMAMIQAIAMIVAAIYKLWRLLLILERVSPKGENYFVDDLKENLRSLRITTNADDLDIAIAYVVAVPHLVGNSSCTSKAAIAKVADDLVNTLIAIHANVLYAKGAARK